MSDTEYKIKVMQAFVDGEEIEVRANRESGSFVVIDSINPRWDWVDFDYRVKSKKVRIDIYRKRDGDYAARLHRMPLVNAKFLGTVEVEE